MPIANLKIELRNGRGSRQFGGVLFETVELLVDAEPRAAALNMALDEVLLAGAGGAVLRVYGWAAPAVSFGYFEEWERAVAVYPGREYIRRWTGGGVVPHGEDWTYSVVVPRSAPFARVPTVESYRVLHESLAEALRERAGGGGEGAVVLTPASAGKVSQACFENPARHDLLLGGQKIAGAAQRRSRFGLLHQGSVQGISLTAGFAPCLASKLAARIVPRTFLAEEIAAAHRLAEVKYGTAGWNHRY